MKRMMIFGAAALLLVVGYAAPSQAKEPGQKDMAGKQVLEGQRGRGGHRGGGRGGRNRGGIHFSFGGGGYGGGYGGYGGYYAPRHRTRYYAPPPPVYYYAPPPTYYYSTPGYGGTVIVR